MRFTRHILSLAAAAAILWVGPPARAQFPSFINDPSVWKGKVVITRDGHAQSDKTDSKGGSYHRRHKKRVVKERTTLEVCGVVGPLHVIKVKKTLVDREEIDKIYRNAKASCAPPGGTGRERAVTVTPGSSGSTIKRTETTLYTGKGAPTLEEGGRVMFQPLPGGNYHIVGGHDCLLSRRSDNVEKKKDPCTGKTKITEHHLRTCPPGTKGKIMDTKNRVTQVRMPPILHRTSFQANRKMGRDQVQGTKTVSEKKARRSGDYAEIVKATWHLKAKDPCREIFHRLGFALVAGEAYADANMRKLAGDNRQTFECLVHDRMAKALKGKPFPRAKKCPSNEGGSGSAEMYVDDKDCSLNQRDVFEKKMKDTCQHPIVFKTTLRHEELHVDQCKKNHARFKSASAENLGQAEVSAYLLEAGMLLSWLKRHCKKKGLDLAGAEKRLDRLRARKAGW